MNGESFCSQLHLMSFFTYSKFQIGRNKMRYLKYWIVYECQLQLLLSFHSEVCFHCPPRVEWLLPGRSKIGPPEPFSLHFSNFASWWVRTTRDREEQTKEHFQVVLENLENFYKVKEKKLTSNRMGISNLFP